MRSASTRTATCGSPVRTRITSQGCAKMAISRLSICPMTGDSPPQLPWGNQSIVLAGDGSVWISESQWPIVRVAKNGSISRVAVGGPVLSLVVGPDGNPRYIIGMNLDPTMALVTLHAVGSTASVSISPRYETSEPLAHEILGNDGALWTCGYHWFYRVALDGSLKRYWIH